jgi:hypothetical protein
MMIMASITKNILKKLAAFYGSAFHDGNWHIALQVAERQGKNGGMFEKPHLSEVTRIKNMRERQDLIDAWERLDPELTHPPPPGQA